MIWVTAYVSGATNPLTIVGQVSPTSGGVYTSVAWSQDGGLTTNKTIGIGFFVPAGHWYKIVAPVNPTVLRFTF